MKDWGFHAPAAGTQPLGYPMRGVLVLICFVASVTASGNENPGQLGSVPQCSTPAPLRDGAHSSPQGLIVRLKADVADPETAMSALAKKDGFKIGHRFPPRRYYIASATQRIIDTLRCEPEVESLALYTLSSTPSGPLTVVGGDRERLGGPQIHR
ncbi:MAG: hypothetical protein JO274_05155 [Gammaproteobacteria bacterium]|nr:hypothetical protein [Gammaproteobacteria bacterium]